MSPQALADRLRVSVPILQAPMAGSSGVALAIAVAKAGGLGALPCAMLTPQQIQASVAAFRAACEAPINLNFFAHKQQTPDPTRMRAWEDALAPFHAQLGLGGDAAPAPSRAPFDDALCALVEALRPECVSFHFGLPDSALVARVKAAGAFVLSSATTLDEALYLTMHGCDAIIAQGWEAGGHRGMFLSEDLSTQIGTFALTRLIAKAVDVPVIASGGIMDAEGVRAALDLGASGVQIGTAYLRSPESEASAVHRSALAQSGETAVTNLFSGRPARGVVNGLMRALGPMRPDAPLFPHGAAPLASLRKAAEAQGNGDFSPLWAGQAYTLAREAPAAEITNALAAGFMGRMGA